MDEMLVKYGFCSLLTAHWKGPGWLYCLCTTVPGESWGRAPACTAPGDIRYTRPSPAPGVPGVPGVAAPAPGTTTVLGDSCGRAPAAGPALEEEPDLPPLCWRARTTPCCR